MRKICLVKIYMALLIEFSIDEVEAIVGKLDDNYTEEDIIRISAALYYEAPSALQ